MRDWCKRLANWVRVHDRLPEEQRDCFEVRPPSAAEWPDGIPTCVALTDFYARCDGGTLGPYSISGKAELTDPSADEWLASFSKSTGALDLKPGRWLDFGSHDFGHTLLWDADADEVLLFSPDDMEPHKTHRSMEEFLARLFRPSRKASNPTVQLWAETLANADKLTD